MGVPAGRGPARSGAVQGHPVPTDEGQYREPMGECDLGGNLVDKTVTLRLNRVYELEVE